MFGAYLVICVNFGLAYAIPTTYKIPAVPPHDNVDLNSLISANSIHLVEKLETDALPGRNTEDTNYPVYHDVIRLPAPDFNDVIFDGAPGDSYIQDGLEGLLSIDALINQGKVPLWREQYLQSAQESNQDTYDDLAPTKVLMDIDMNNYEDDDNTLPNPVLPLESLPNIYSTYVHEAVPSLETRGSYDIDVLNPENTDFLPPNMRLTRSRNDDFMAQLAHDTIMNNIVPTMPFVRGVEEYPSRPALETAIYPNGGSKYGCGLPFLLSCKTSVRRGTLGNSYPEYIQPAVPVLPYRGDIAPEIKELL